MVKSENTTVCVTLPRSTVKMIDYFAAQGGLKRSSFVNLAVLSFLGKFVPDQILHNPEDFLRFVGKKPE